VPAALLAMLPSLLPLLTPLLGGLLGGGQSSSGSAGSSGSASSLAALAPLLERAGAGGESASPGPVGAAQPAAPSTAEQVGTSTAGAFLAQQLARVADRQDPQAQAGLQELGRRAAQDPIISAQERTARELVQRVKDELGPQLNEIRSLARERSLQVQATSEHREVVARDEFRREVLAALRRIEAQGARAAGAGGRRY
jgi:hypothetical protein